MNYCNVWKKIEFLTKMLTLNYIIKWIQFSGQSSLIRGQDVDASKLKCLHC